MDPSSGASAVASAVNAFTSSQSGLSVIALRTAEKEQASVLQLFNPANAVPPPGSGRGQQVNISV
jgi:hypothetical protein